MLMACNVSNGNIEPHEDPLVEAAGDIALVVGRQCVGVISQPDLPYPDNSKEVERWLTEEFVADPNPVVDGREACIVARADGVVGSEPTDCDEVESCLSGFGIVFPDPWPE